VTHARHGPAAPNRLFPHVLASHLLTFELVGRLCDNLRDQAHRPAVTTDIRHPDTICDALAGT
jgi:hypothetical protein